MRNPYIMAVQTRLAKKDRTPEEIRLLAGLLRQFQKIDQQFSVPFVSKLLKVAAQCEAGGHKSRARMFRALAKEFEIKIS